MAARQDNSPAKRGAGSRILRLLLVALVGIVVAAILLVTVPPAGLIKDQIERAASAASGRTVTIGDAQVKLWPMPSVSLSNVAMANPDGVTRPQFLQAQTVNASLKLKPLFSGKAEIESFEIIQPQINLIKNAAGGTNWAFEPKAQTSAGPAVSLLNGATITDGLITYTTPDTKEPVRFERVNATIEANGKTTAKGALAHHGESASVDISINDVLGAMAGKPTDLKFAVDGKFIKGQINGVASNAAAPELNGDVTLTSGSVRDLARWLGSDIAAGAAPLPGSVTGKIKATASSINFDGTNVMLGADASKLTGKLAFDGARPKYEGSIAVPRIDLDALLGTTPSPVKAAGPEADVELELETAPAWDGLRDTLQGLSAGQDLSAGAGPEAAPVSKAKTTPKPSVPAWSEAPIDLKILQSADLNAIITADQLVLGKLDLKNAQINAQLTNGKLDAKLEKLSVGAGSATGKLILDSSKAVPHADVAINLVNVAAEPIIAQITGKPLLAGTSNVDITAAGDGRNQLALASSLEGKAKFRMSKGVIRGFDVRAIMSNWWNSLTGGLKFDINKKTGFEKLDAQYDIKNGLLTSSPGLDIGGSEVEVQSRGNVSLPAKLINQQIRVKVVPPPAAPPIPVTITGNWAKPNISMDWGDLLFSSGVSNSARVSSSSDGANTAAPEALTAEPPEADSIAGGFRELAPKPNEIPDDVIAQIKSVLASDQAGAITPEGRALLETLLPANPENAPAAPVEAPTEAPQGAETPAAP